MLLFILNSIGVLIAHTIVAILFFLFCQTISEKHAKTILTDLYVKLGRTEHEVEDSVINPHLYAMFSSEKINNRISDLVGAILKLFSTLVSWSLFLGIIGTIAYLAYNKKLEDGSYLWLFVAAQLTYYVIFIAAAFITKLLTNRFPGQAKSARASIEASASQ